MERATAPKSAIPPLGAHAARPASAYGAGMREELLIDMRRTQLLAVDSSLEDARRALARAARVPSAFAGELRALLVVLADLERRVLADAGADVAPKADPKTDA